MKPSDKDFESHVGMTYKEAVEYLKQVGMWEQNKDYSGYEIVASAIYRRDKELKVKK